MVPLDAAAVAAAVFVLRGGSEQGSMGYGDDGGG